MISIKEAMQSMVGKTLAEVQNCKEESEDMLLIATDGTKLRFRHYADCCEHVRIQDVAGDVNDLVGTPLTMCEAVSSDEPEGIVCEDDSHTWTFFKFATAKGYVTVRWLGESNGYYGETPEISLNDKPIYEDDDWRRSENL